jgi:hypothetical protein
MAVFWQVHLAAERIYMAFFVSFGSGYSPPELPDKIFHLSRSDQSNHLHKIIDVPVFFPDKGEFKLQVHHESLGE